MNDPLAIWWVHPVIVQRFTKSTAYMDDDEYAPAETITGLYEAGNSVVRAPGGDEVVAAGRFAFRADVAYVPPKSKVTIPDEFGGGTAYVITSEPARGPSFVPAHQVITVK